MIVDLNDGSRHGAFSGLTQSRPTSCQIWIWVCATSCTTSARYCPNFVYFISFSFHISMWVPNVPTWGSHTTLDDVVMDAWGPSDPPYVSQSTGHLCSKANFITKMLQNEHLRFNKIGEDHVVVKLEVFSVCCSQWWTFPLKCHKTYRASFWKNIQSRDQSIPNMETSMVMCNKSQYNCNISSKFYSIFSHHPSAYGHES